MNTYTKRRVNREWVFNADELQIVQGEAEDTIVVRPH